MTLYWLALVLASFASALVLHRFACRLLVKIDRVARFLIVGSIAGVCLIWAIGARYGLASIETIGAALVYGFLCELYIFLFTMTISSISANVLVRLSAQDMSIEEISQRYDSRQMVRQRLERLVAAGLLFRAETRLVLTQKGIRFVSVFQALRRFFRHA